MFVLSIQMTGQVSLFYVLISAVKDLIPLRHFGKKEMLAKIDLMEDWYNVLMWSDPDCIPA